MLKKLILSTFLVAFLQGCASMGVLVTCLIGKPFEPKPTVKRGDFLLKISYLKDGKKFSVVERFSCSYAGRSCDGRGLYNDWDQRMENGDSHLKLKTISDNEYIYVPTGSCSDLMKGKFFKFDGSAYLYVETEHSRGSSWINPDELLNKYGIKITEYEVRRLP